MTFTQLEIFALVAELGSYTAAGGRLGISQSAVSHALKQLEGEWGIKVLQRTASGVEVTSAGRGLLVRVRELLGVSEAIGQEVSALRGLESGVLRIGSFGTSSSLQLLPHLLARFHQHHPGVDVRVDEGEDAEVAQWILERRVDVGFVALPDDRFHTVPIADDHFVALVPTASRLAQQRSVQLPELCDRPFILTLAGSAGLVQGLFEAAGLRPTIKHRFAQVITIIKMVEMGAGVSIVADLAAPPEIMALCPGVAKKPLSPMARRSVGLAVQSLPHASPATQAFLRLAKARPTR